MNRRKFLGLTCAAGASTVGALVANQHHASRFTEGLITPVQHTAAGPDSVHATDPTDGSALIVFFSHKRATYPELDLDVGHTEQLAGFIFDRVGADMFRVEPSVDYPEDYADLDRMAEGEEQNLVYRDIKPGAPDTDPYATVFLGYPIWWGEQPMVLQTFMRDHNLNGKNIVPFCTHEGSRFGNSLRVVTQYYPDATLLDGFARRGQDVYADPDDTRGAVNSWLQEQGF